MVVWLGENHKAIFPRSQLSGFTGTPNFEQNAVSQEIEGEAASLVTSMALIQNELQRYTVPLAIEDGNELRCQADHFKPKEEKGKTVPKPGEAILSNLLNECI